ncbi:MAG TPA: hypothetical protein VGC04_10300 [Cellulomonas sp.]
MTAQPQARARALLVLAAALALVTGGLFTAVPASAADVVPADPAIGGTLYLADANDGTDFPVGASIGWNDPVMALPKPGDLSGRLVAPAGTQSVVTFVGPQGRESDPTSWNATAPWDFTPPGQWMEDVTPYHLITPGRGTPSGTNATATVSGDYSLGVAYLKDGGLHVVPGGLYFVHIHLTGNPVPDKATYTWQPIEATGPAVAGGGSVGVAGASGAPAGMLSFVATPASSGNPLGGLTVSGGTSAAATWTVTVSGGAATATLASGSGAATPVDTSHVPSPVSGAGRITLTVVGG